jgi:hypothetical protein
MSGGPATPRGGAPAAAAIDDETYPRWCLAVMVITTLIAFGSHAAPTDWLRSSRPVVHSVAAQDTEISTALFSAPSALPHAAVLEEVRGAAARATCAGLLLLLQQKQELLLHHLQEHQQQRSPWPLSVSAPPPPLTPALPPSFSPHFTNTPAGV